MVARHFDCNGDDAHWEAEVVPAKSGGFIVSASTIVTSIVYFFYRQNTFSSFLFQFLEKIPAQLYTNDLQISEIYLFHPQEFKIWQTYLLVVMLIVILVAMVEMLVMMWLATLVLMLVISAGGGVGGHDKCWNIKQRMRESIKNNIQMLNPFLYSWKMLTSTNTNSSQNRNTKKISTQIQMDFVVLGCCLTIPLVPLTIHQRVQTKAIIALPSHLLLFMIKIHLRMLDISF